MEWIDHACGQDTQLSILQLSIPQLSIPQLSIPQLSIPQLMYSATDVFSVLLIGQLGFRPPEASAASARRPARPCVDADSGWSRVMRGCGNLVAKSGRGRLAQPAPVHGT